MCSPFINPKLSSALLGEEYVQERLSRYGELPEGEQKFSAFAIYSTVHFDWARKLREIHQQIVALRKQAYDLENARYEKDKEMWDAAEAAGLGLVVSPPKLWELNEKREKEKEAKDDVSE